MNIDLSKKLLKSINDDCYRIEGIDPPGKWRIYIQYPTFSKLEYYSDEEVNTFKRMFNYEEQQRRDTKKGNPKSN